MVEVDRVIQSLQACHIDHVCLLMEKAEMTPMNKYQIEFLLTEPTCEFVGLFESEVKVEEQQPLGVACLMKDGETDFLSLLIVDSRYRRQGIGEKLTRWAVDRSKKSKAQPKAMTLCASSLGAPVYTKIGFKAFGHARLYKLSTDALEKQERHELALSSLVSFFVDSIKHDGSKESSLWRQAQEMMSDALNPLDGKVSRFTNFVQPFVAHILCNDNADSKSTVLAWCTVGRFTSSSRIIGPIFGKSTEDVMNLVRRVVERQLDVEKANKRQMLDSNEDASFYLHTDIQSGDEGSFADSLEKDGWQESAKAQWMVCDFGNWHEATKRPTSGARQFALADFSEG